MIYKKKINSKSLIINLKSKFQKTKWRIKKISNKNLVNYRLSAFSRSLVKKISNSHRTNSGQAKFLSTVVSFRVFVAFLSLEYGMMFLVKVVLVVVVLVIVITLSSALTNRNGLTIPWRLFSKRYQLRCQVSCNCWARWLHRIAFLLAFLLW